ncbi:anthranilate phosphoribosyltransferase [bacterium]|nr:anthranilate phosphoribosyltransferase [bacterium]
MQVQSAIAKCIGGTHLSREEASRTAEDIMSGKATGAQIGSLLTALRIKGETIDEITGFTAAMRAQCVAVPCVSDSLVDTCGTGGDGKGTFNVSTVSAFVAAGAGCKVAKHGNRAISGKCGSADLLAELGIPLHLPPEAVAACIREAGIGFLFAPAYHSAMKYVLGPRREIGARTIFNVLGPLTNPAGVRRQVIGVYHPDLTPTLAHVLKALGSLHVLVVHGRDGTDEISLSGETLVAELKGGTVREYTIHPEQFGMRSASLASVRGGGSEENVRIALDVLGGEPGPARDIVLLNAGAVIYVSGRSESLAAGIDAAGASIDSGSALRSAECLRRTAIALQSAPEAVTV